jgi:hypothetical protein
MEQGRMRAGTKARRRARRRTEDVPEPEHGVQPTTIAVEAARTGVVPRQAPREPEEIPGPENEKIRVGDPDVSPLINEYSGEEAPGASTPTPDQNRVDDIGRAYGLEEEDTGALRSSAEILDRRDRHRQD